MNITIGAQPKIRRKLTCESCGRPIIGTYMELKGPIYRCADCMYGDIK